MLMERKNGLRVDVSVSEARTRAEREGALVMVRRAKRRHRLKMRTLAAERGHAAGSFLHELEAEEGVAPLVTMPNVLSRSEGEEAEARRRAKRRQRKKRNAPGPADPGSQTRSNPFPHPYQPHKEGN